MSETEKREPDVFVGQWANANRIECSDCIYRDRLVVKIDGVEKPVGATRSNCERFPKGEMYKPMGVVLRGEHCEYFERE